MIKQNFLKVIKNKFYLTLFIFLSFAFNLFFFLFTEIDLIKGNFGKIYFYTLFFSQIFLSLFFALFIVLTIYKYNSFKIIRKKSFLSIFFIPSFLLAGCAGCSITLISILGLSSFVSLFPYYGLEIKLLSLAVLVYVIYHMLKNLGVCKIKKKKKKL